MDSERFGFDYISSMPCQNSYAQINIAIENGVKKLNDSNLLAIFNRWREINEMREHTMLTNIYAYSRVHNYSRAAFTIGAAHGKSLSNKIVEYRDREDPYLEWKFYNIVSQ